MSRSQGTPLRRSASSFCSADLNTSNGRLHVHIYDTIKQQFQVPESVISRPVASPSNSTEPDLEFHYTPSPFEFWITRKEDGADGAPLFDTRNASLPAAPIPPLNSSDPRTALDGFSLIFEDQYLQVRLVLISTGIVPDIELS